MDGRGRTRAQCREAQRIPESREGARRVLCPDRSEGGLDDGDGGGGDGSRVAGSGEGEAREAGLMLFHLRSGGAGRGIASLLSGESWAGGPFGECRF